jgi:hypothetical protein
VATAARHLALPHTNTRSTTRTTSTKKSNPAKSFLLSAVLLVSVVALAMTGAGSTYAMWSGKTSVDASTVSSASTGLTINGSTSYTIPAMNLAQLSPGQSVMIPLTLANSGTTPLNAVVSNVTISSDTQLLSNELTIRATQSSSCIPSTAAGTRLASFATTTTPFALAIGASVPVCLELKMDVDAPQSVSGGSTTFALNLTATQVRNP